MKILIVSLLRIGDLVMCAPVVDGLRRRHPRAKIDLLTNACNRGTAPLFHGLRRVHYFDRDLIQQGLGAADQPIFVSYDILKNLIDEINAENYDLVINLTQTRLSGYICALINAKDKLGLVMTENEQAAFGSHWFRHLNDFAGAEAPHVFHLTDIFKGGSGLDDVECGSGLKATAKGREEIERIEELRSWKERPLVVVQPSTSDEKKNWLAPRWAEFIQYFSEFFPDAAVAVLGAPAEQAAVDEIARAARNKGATAAAVIVTLEGAYALLERADLCVSVDTSIKHLAAAAGIPVAELVFGGSDFRRTGAYSDKTLILRAREECQPCAHSRPCHRSQRFCAERVSAIGVASVVAQFLREDFTALATVAAEFGDEFDCYLGKISADGFWWPLRVGGAEAPEQNYSYLLELFAWKMLLRKDHLERVIPFGVYQRKLRESMTPPPGATPLFDALARKYYEQSRQIAALQNRLVRASLDNAPDIEREFVTLEERLSWRGVLAPRWRETCGKGLAQIRRMQQLLSDAEQLQHIRIKMLQSIA